MTTYALVTPSLLRLSFGPRRRTTPPNVRTERLEQGMLRALFRLAREGQPAQLQDVALVMGLSELLALQPVLDRLLRAGLVQRQGEQLALTLAGLAVASPRPRVIGVAPVHASVC